MNTREFLSRILPETGTKYLAELRSFSKDGDTITFFKHYPYESANAMAGAALDLDEEEVPVYFALAGFSDPVQKMDPRYNRIRTLYRTQAQAIAVKAFWMDIDCSPAKAEIKQGYATKGEAAAAIKEFCMHTHLPVPIIVDSGGGLHCYWPLTQEISGENWTKIAPIWRAVIGHYGVRSDPSRDIDVASVLRPVGTTNRKPGRPERKVKVAHPGTGAIAPGEFVKLLTAQMRQHDIAARTRASKPKAAAPSLNDDLATFTEGPKSSAAVVAEHCGQVREFITSGGDVSEPIWRGMLGLIKHCTEGDDYAHAVSSGYDGYSFDETQEKLDRWEAGPTTCATFGMHCPSICESCPHNGKITSPIQLGIPKAEAPVVVETTAADGKAREAIELPDGFGVGPSGGLVRYVEDADGVLTPVPVTEFLFQVVRRIYDQSAGEYLMRIRVLKSRNRTQYFEMPTSVIFSSKLGEALAAREILLMNGKSINHVRDFLRLSVRELERAEDESQALTRFGWDADVSQFSIGNKLFTKSGVEEAQPLGHAQSEAVAFTNPRGSAAGWADAINGMYSRPGMEPFQYAISSVLGSLITPLADNATYRGLLLGLTSTRSGIGKTTAVHMGLYALGDPMELTIAGKEGATNNALFTKLATLNNIPVLLDEWSSVGAQQLGEVAYSVVNGKDRMRLTQTAKMQETRTWAQSPIITSNNNLARILTSEGVNAEAQAVRILEFPLDAMDIPMLDPASVRDWERRARANRGAAGLAFIEYIVANADSVADRIQRWTHRFIDGCPSVVDSKYRFYRGHVACTMAATEIMATELGLLSFDIEQLFSFMCRHVADVIAEVVELHEFRPQDALTRMVNDAQPGIIVTHGYAHHKQPDEVPIRAPSGSTPLVGRFIGVSDRTPPQLRGLLALSANFVRKWCVDHRVDLAMLLSEGRRAGLILPPGMAVRSDQLSLGRGTTTHSSTGRERVILIDASVLAGKAPRMAPADPIDLNADLGVNHG